MNKDNAKDYLPLVQAWAEGKTLELKTNNGWEELTKTTFFLPVEYYRIKPEPREIWVAFNSNGTICGATEDYRDEPPSPGVDVYIKFREVIE